MAGGSRRQRRQHGRRAARPSSSSQWAAAFLQPSSVVDSRMCSTVLGRQCIGRAPRRQGAGAVPHAARQRELIGGPQPPAYVFLLAQFTLQFVQAASRKPAPSTDFRWPVSIVGGAPPPAGAPGEPGGAAKAREARRGCSGGRSRPAQAAVTGAAAAAPCPRGPRWGARSCQTTRPCCTATTMASTRCGCRPTARAPWTAPAASGESCGAGSTRFGWDDAIRLACGAGHPTPASPASPPAGCWPTSR